MNKKIIFAICRDFGSEGHEIGKELSERLHIPLYDKDLLAMAADECSVNIDKLAQIDEQKVRKIVSSYPGSEDILSGDRLFKVQSDCILRLAQQGSCILIGRLADYLLRDDPDCIKVLITASFDKRVEIIQKKRGLSKEAAARLVRKMDSSRKSYYHCYSNGKWSHETGKDFILNRGTLGIDGCVDVLEYWARRMM